MTGAVLLATGSVWSLASEGADAPWWRWGMAITFAIFTVVSVVRLIGEVRRLRRFTAAHGSEAGRQTPVDRP